MKAIETVEAADLKKLPQLNPGDTVKVHVRVKETSVKEEKGKAKEGELEWQLAIALMPGFYGVYMDLAHKYREAHLCAAAIPLYQKALSIEPDLPLADVSVAACQLEIAQWRRARTTSRVAIAAGTYRRAFRYMIGLADSALVATDSLDPTIGAKWLARRSR